MWVDNTKYKEKYLLGRKPIIPETEFSFWSRKAETEVNWRKIELDDIPEFLVNCICEVAELLYIQWLVGGAETGGQVVKSFSNDGYSETYGSTALSKSAMSKAISDIIINNISNTSLHNQFVFRG